MSFLLDTNICSAHLKRPAGLIHRFIQHSGRLFIPTVVLGELYTWAFKRADPAPLLQLVDNQVVAELVGDLANPEHGAGVPDPRHPAEDRPSN